MRAALIVWLVPLTVRGEEANAPATARTVLTVAGTGQSSNNGDAGPAHDINIGQPFGVELGPDGALYVTEVQHHRIRRIDLSSGQVATVAGNGTRGYAGDGGLACEACLNEPYEVRFDSRGHWMLIVEMQNHLVRRVHLATGRIETVAGTGDAGFGGDGGSARQAQFRQPHSIALYQDRWLYIADIGNHRIRQVDLQTDIVTTVAGTGAKELPREGQPALGGPVLGPRALTIRNDTLWVALREGHSVWSLQLSDLIWHHVAGDGRRGFRDGPAESAQFDGPKGIACGPTGLLYIVDTENQRIREVNTDAGQVTTVAGSGRLGDEGDRGPALRGSFHRPHGICIDSGGTIYIGDTSNHRVRSVKFSQP